MRLTLPQHGRNHRHNGSDPIGTFLEFNVDNVGDWLSIEATDVDPDMLYSLHVNVTGPGVTQLETNGGGDFIIRQNAGFMLIEATHLEIENDSASDTLDIYSAGGYGIGVANGKTITFYRDSGTTHPIFRIDSDGSLHGVTGKSLVFDL